MAILVQYEILWSEHVEAVYHSTGLCHCDSRGTGIKVDDAARFPTLFAPIQEFSGHLQPIHDVAILTGVKCESLLLQQQAITVDEIAHSRDVGKSVAIRHLYHGVGVIHCHTSRGTTRRQRDEIAVGAAGQDFKIRSSGIVSIDLPACVGALHHDGTECCLTKRLVLVQQQLITFIRQQQAGIEAVGCAAFSVEFEISLVRKCSHTPAQPHTNVVECVGKASGAVNTQLAIIINDPINITGLAGAIAVQRCQAFGVQTIALIPEILCYFIVKHIAISISKQTEKLGRFGES